jgi:hypothetical protein
MQREVDTIGYEMELDIDIATTIGSRQADSRQSWYRVANSSTDRQSVNSLATDRQLVNSLAHSSTDRQLVNSLANSSTDRHLVDHRQTKLLSKRSTNGLSVGSQQVGTYSIRPSVDRQDIFAIFCTSLLSVWACYGQAVLILIIIILSVESTFVRG